MAGQNQRTLLGWDPILIVSQIVSLQALHYLTLSLLIPPLLWVFAEPNALMYEGGAMNVGMVMDWREMAGWPTVHGLQGDDRRGWSVFRGAYSGGQKVGTGTWIDPFKDGDRYYQWDGRTDPLRGWVVAFCWMVTAGADVLYIYTLVRRPRLVLDFSLTLLLVHIVLTTYYSGALPSSPFVWLAMAGGTIGTVVVAEQLCVRREMREGLQTLSAPTDVEEIEMGTRRPLPGSRID
ncbi:uncharacterized protein FOMMEDRAFT_112301 [Fomitiporia mediterranea MF3/22]|uniref:uncharacterized protein n=1 Tax=Fomitiporia mediterranea (strain MF3/22) TaxID=694068 RepID=UPI0004407C03|nr:uncharacterized protein FOMMEDRAFT_112301 [Fomitiporia mediterranea MF3/22]EJC99986.1 hypothetical protein FOMMEDRAFT_112301 [Fomitiporia mediterranea MF3/22]